MSHQFLPFFGEPPSPTRGHCQYMEQLRRSIEHLRHQTSSASPCSLSTSSSDFSKRSLSRLSDTLGVNNRDSPDCMVVYEPYTTPSNTPSSGVSNSCHGYMSSSSGSCSSVDGRRDDTPTNVLEDSGVDLGDTYTRSKHRNHHHTHQSDLKDRNNTLIQTRFHSDQHDGNSERNSRARKFRTFGKNIERCHTDERRDSAEVCLVNQKKPVGWENKSIHEISKSSDFLVNNNILISSQTNSEDKSDNGKVKQKRSSGKVGKKDLDSAGTCHLGKSVDKSTHTNVTEIGGVCFCAVEPRRKRTDVDKTNLHTTQAVVHSHTSPTCHQSEKNTSWQQLENVQKTPETHDNQTSGDFEEIFIDSPMVTPIVGDKNQDLDLILVTQSCQTDKSVFRRKKKDVNKSIQQNHGTQLPRDSYNKMSNLLRTDLSVIKKPNVNGHQTITSGGLNHNSEVFGESENTQDFVREGSIRSLMSITDTMSVTSMEVANIMAASEESQKSAVTLEKERLRLQHQRLESYQANATEEPLNPEESPNPTDIFDRYCNDESLRKQKIVKSVLENIPVNSPVAKTSGKSIHTFVAQSLQSFFTESKHSKDMKSLGSSTSGAFKRNQPKDEQSPLNEGQNKRGVVSPSLYQLTTAFRLFHVSYGDPTDLNNMRLISCEVKLDQRSAPASPGGGSVDGVGELTTSRLPTKAGPPGVRYTFLVIAELRNHRMEMDEGGIQPGDHIIEMNDSCMLNQTPEVFFDLLERTKLVHLVIGRRRHPLRNHNPSDTSYGDSVML